jgi:probable HAF family extracellular repeat protein
MKKSNKMFQKSPLSRFVQTCLSLTAFSLLGFIVIKPVNAQTLHTGFSSYQIEDLGLGSSYGMNNLGQALVGRDGVGWVRDNNGQFTEITNSTWANQINNYGQVVGRYLSQNWIDNAYLWENGQRTELGYNGGISSTALDINDAGQIVGKFNLASDKFNPFLWENGTMIDLGTLGFNGGAQAINNQGQVVGYSGLRVGITHAFIWDKNNLMQDLGTLSPDYKDSIAYDINDAGQAVGASSSSTLQQVHATLWSNGQVINLGTLGGNQGTAVAINNKGQVVGYDTTTGDGGLIHPFIWEDGEIADLNSLFPHGKDWFLQEVSDINDNGQILGKGFYRPTGKIHSFLLTPSAGSSQRYPLLPKKISENNWYQFDNVLNRQWFDPPTAAGFRFKIGDVASSGDEIIGGAIPEETSLFTKILSLPSGIDADELFSVLVGGKQIGKFKPNEVVDFVALLGYGVSEFSVTGIDAAIDPKNPLAFPIKLESNQDQFSFKMRAMEQEEIEAVPEPSEIAGIVTSAAFFTGLVFKRKRKSEVAIAKDV